MTCVLALSAAVFGSFFKRKRALSSRICASR